MIQSRVLSCAFLVAAIITSSAFAQEGAGSSQLPATKEAQAKVPAQPASPAPSDPGKAVVDAGQQLAKFKSIYDQAQKVLGDEHTIISPSFYFATDIQGRLSPTDKHQAGVSAVLMVPLLGIGGGHGFDVWPVLVSEDKTDVYQAFLEKLTVYQDAVDKAQSLNADKAKLASLTTNMTAMDVAKVIKQLVCEEDMEIDEAVLGNICGAPAGQTVDAKAAVPKLLAPKRHNLLVGPSLGIPISKNPTDIFQLGLSAEIGGGGRQGFRIMATGGFIGRYSGATYKDIFGAGWYAGLALSGELGDELFHFFNGGSTLMTALADAKSDTTTH